MNAITAFLEPEDILVRAPKEGSAYQLMARRRLYATMFKGGYDMLQYTDMRVEGVFDMFRLYNVARSTMEPCVYADGTRTACGSGRHQAECAWENAQGGMIPTDCPGNRE